MKVTSISRKLLSRVLSLYFLLTLIVTGVQIFAEYFNAKSHINSELLTLEKTFSGSLTRAVWELNTQQAIDIAEGLVAIPMIKGIKVTDENDQVITQLGEIGEDTAFNYESATNINATSETQNMSSISGRLFGHTFPLIFEFSGRTTKVGSVTLLSSNEVIFNRIEVGLYFLIGNAMVKTAALVFLFTLAFNKLLTAPLNELTEQINQLDLDDPEASKLHSMNFEKNELNILEDAYNNLIDELVQFKEKLALAQSEILSANQRLDEQNLLLEQEVAKKTSSLSTTMLKMEMQQRELLKQQDQLKDENNRRRQTEHTLTHTNKDLKESVLELNKAQERLLSAEKMAVLGSLSAEVSHEINTPIGVSITSTSYLSDALEKIKEEISGQTITKRGMEDFIDNATQSIDLLMNNLTRASDLISSYKQVAVDQTSDKIRQLNVAKYVDEVIQSLHPKLKKTTHSVKVNCPDNIEMYVHAGAIAQIVTNLIINSIIHGFEGRHRGEIKIDISYHNELLHMKYQDNGVGVPQDALPGIFDPFYTTKAGQGGSGLGTHIIHSLVTDTLNGKIKATSAEGEGLTFDIEFANMK
ncbi:HAMP domain-containing histidine kinase [Thalassotalea sp. M1531]|uniref:histidine kinase n=1 Tax=Thalassotalea algicola TaxID=2716224 RepID=A0A7Y0LAI9_9GAMM|nr:HAMP domain-containing sensor histidine kinase [Thalassotalea algicola]NMP30984.1 HAMP domain-containing histidine kinase [Thalassotalea algicola]